MRKFIIYNNSMLGIKLYWNNKDGWGDRKSATRFSKAEVSKYIHLPLNGQWIKEK